MTRQTASRNGKYIYAIIPDSENQSYAFTGIDGRKVYSISNGRLAAVISDIPSTKLRPQRRNIAAHNEVLKKLVEKSTVLPMTFGIVADGPMAIQKILFKNQGALLDQLALIAGKLEMGIRVRWDVPNIFEYFVGNHLELKEARDRLINDGEVTQEDKIEVGRLFEQALMEDRELYCSRVEEVLSRYCSEIKRNKCREEREVMSLACLVGKDVLGTFENGILEAAELFDDSFAFNYNGPWVPHNFVQINLSTGRS